MPALIAWASRLVERHSWAVLLSLLAVLLPAGFLASRLSLESSFTALLPESAPAVAELKAGSAKTGGSALALLAIDARDRPRAERYADAFAARARTMPWARFIQARLDLDFIRSRALLYLDQAQLEALTDELSAEIDQRTLGAAGLGLDLGPPSKGSTTSFDLEARYRAEATRLGLPTAPYLVDASGRWLYVLVGLRGGSGEMDFAARTRAAIEALAEEVKREQSVPGLELKHTGSLVLWLEHDGFLRRDLTLASLLGSISVVLLLALYTRRLRALVLLGLPLFIGVTSTFAFAAVAVGRLNIVSGFLASILSGLGIELGIHLLFRYVEEREQGLEPAPAQARSLASAGRSLIGSALSNAAAFGVVALAGFRGFREFGLIAAVGMVLTLVITLLGFPALNLLLERWRPMRLGQKRTGARRELRVPRGLRRVVLVAVPAFAIYSAIQLGTGQVHFRSNWRELKGVSPESDFYDAAVQSIGGSLYNSWVLADSPAQVSAVVKVIAAHRAAREAQGAPCGIRGTRSLDDLVPADQEAKLPLLRELARQLGRLKPEQLSAAEQRSLTAALELTAARPFGLEDLPESLRAAAVAPDGRTSLVTLVSDWEFNDSDQLAMWAEEMSALSAELHEAGLSTPIISEDWIAGAVFQTMKKDGWFIISGSLLVVFLVVWLDFRSLRQASLVLLALVIGQVSIAGAMRLFGIELNFINAAVLPIVVGVSVDNAIHIRRRHLQDGPGSIPRILRSTVSATTLSSATNLMGFGAMIVAHHAGLRSVATLAFIGIGLTFLSTSVFFPLALEELDEHRRTK